MHRRARLLLAHQNFANFKGTTAFIGVKGLSYKFIRKADGLGILKKLSHEKICKLHSAIPRTLMNEIVLNAFQDFANQITIKESK